MGWTILDPVIGTVRCNQCLSVYNYREDHVCTEEPGFVQKTEVEELERLWNL